MYRIMHMLRTLRENTSADMYEVYDNGISFLNFYGGDWFRKFVEYYYPDRTDYNFVFSSVNGKRTALSKYKGKKIFFSGENVEPYIKHKLCLERENESLHWWFLQKQKLYYDYRIHEVDLACGYGLHADCNYLRFPLWLIYLFPPYSTYDDVKNIVSNINNMRSKAVKEAVCMNKHDVFGLRSKLCNDVSPIIYITYAGKWRHNSDELWNEYCNDKLKYLNLFKFNICPENMDAEGYCTQKIFDAFRCGCIPVYAGCENKPEPECINRDAVILWNLDDDNDENLKLVKRLNEDESFYAKFVAQERLKPYTVEYVMDSFNELKKRLGELL